MKFLNYIAFPVFSIFMLQPAVALDCRAPSTQIEQNQCASFNLERETSKINKTYNTLRAKLPPLKQQQLKEVQLVWIKFRDVACKFNASGVEGGSSYSMVLSNCLAEETRQRNKTLESLGNCQEGDVSCPAW